jgi:hypothetical protein
MGCYTQCPLITHGRSLQSHYLTSAEPEPMTKLAPTEVLLMCCCRAAASQVCCGAVLGVLFGIFYPNPTAGQLLVGV